jgi:parallel beta-helix repeat protein
MQPSNKKQQILTLLTALTALTVTPIFAVNLVQAQTVQTIKIAQQNQQTIIYVDAQKGDDSAGTGVSENSPYRTITYAIQQSQPGTIIQLAPGTYQDGEMFPLKLKKGVSLKGSETDQGKSVIITGGGEFLSKTFAGQDVTIVAGVDSEISGITVTNPNERGTGIWLESSNAKITNSTFIKNNREGLFISGKSQPTIENNQFINNRGNGISIASESGGEIKNNLFDNTGFAITVAGTASPNITNNEIKNNRDGIVVTENSRPKIADNTIENNSEYGVVATGDGKPELGTNKYAKNGTNELTASTPQGTAPMVASNTENTENTTNTEKTQGTTTNTEKPQLVANTTMFNCVPLDQGYATVAQRGNQTIPQPMITWSRVDLGPDLTPQSRCAKVTDKLNKLVASNGGTLDNLNFTTGRIKGLSVICLVNGETQGCNNENLVFTLSKENAKKADQVLKSLINFSTTGTGTSVQESQGRTYASLGQLNKKLQPELGLWFVKSKGSK